MANDRRVITLENWIADALADTEKGQLSQISLIHKIGQADEEVYTRKFHAGNPSTAKELATMFWNKAASYAQDLSGAQTFNLLAFYGKNEPEARQPFLIMPPPINEGLATEGPTATGALQQGMRLSEMVVGGTFRERSILLQYFSQTIEQQNTIIQRLMVENHDANQIVVEVLRNQVQLAHEQKMKELEFERATKERQALVKLLPALANRVTGKEIFPQAVEEESLFDQFAEELGEDEVMKIAEALQGKPKLLGAVMSKFADYQKKKEKEQKELDELLGKKNGTALAKSS